MPRRSQQIPDFFEPVEPRQAATVLLLRDGSSGMEVLMTRRAATARFAAGAYVFPGGCVDANDTASHELSLRRPGQDDSQLTHALAAIRETFEELGILLTVDAAGDWPDPDLAMSLNRRAPLGPQCLARGLKFAANKLFLLAHWVTDRDMACRYDVPFFVARMPPGQEAISDDEEQFDPQWVDVNSAAARHAHGGLVLMVQPTLDTLVRISAYEDVGALLRACSRDQPLWSSCPRVGWFRGKEARYMEDDPTFAELELVCPQGQLAHALDWQHDKPVALLRNVSRLYAGDHSQAALGGSNAYIVGDANSGYAVVDPRSDEPAYIARIHAAANGNIRMIICTTFSCIPAARALQASYGQQRVPLRGRGLLFEASDFDAKDGELLILRANTEGADDCSAHTHTLEVIHMDRSDASSLCLLLREDGLLFGGNFLPNDSLDGVLRGRQARFHLPASGPVRRLA